MSDRRQNAERRFTKERRQSRKRDTAYDSYTVIEIANTELRAVMLKRSADDMQDQVSNVTIRWRHEANVLNSDLGLQELAAALKELSDQYDLHSTHLQFVLSGEFCVTKAVRGTTEEVRNELQQIEQRSRLYLMLGPGEKVTVSKSQPLDARHQQAVAAVCNQQTLNTIHEAAHQAGMQIESIEPALVSSSRAIGRLADVPDEPCLLIHLDQATVELGVCHHGSLLLDYRPGGHTNPNELAELVHTHLSRLQRHVGRQLHASPPELKRVYLCGEQTAVDQAYPVFAASEQFEVEKIDPAKIQATWEFTEAFNDSAAVPALGSLLSTYLPTNELHTPNFMMHIIASTQMPIKPVLIRSLMPMAAVLLVALSLFAVNLSKQSTLDSVQAQIDELANVQANDRKLRLQRGAAVSKLAQLETLAGGLQALPASEVITRIANCMPSDVWLSHMELNGMKSIRLNGLSFEEDGYVIFIKWLSQAPGFEDVALRSTQPGRSATGPTINFNVELSIGDWNSPVKEVARNE